MRILVNYGHYKDHFHVHTLAADAKTVIGPSLSMENRETLLKLLRYVGADLEEVERDLRRWGHGSVWADLVPKSKNVLRLRAPWNEGLI